ncbi:MAG: PAS domain-containing protein [Rhodospirillaceae bacterium]|nr:PAS domain-containing protein [Rhodospirillaceae bacterium]
MPEREPLHAKSIRRLLVWAVGLSIPTWIILLVMAAFDRLGWLDAGLAACAIFLFMLYVSFVRLGDFERLTRYAETLFENPDAPSPPAYSSAMAQRMMTALNSLRRVWAERREEAASLAKSRQDILDSLPDPLLLLDRQRRVVGANLASLDLLGRDLGGMGTGRDLLGRDLAGVIRDPKVLDAAAEALSQNKRTDAQFSLSAPMERTFRTLLVPVSSPGSRDGTALILAFQEQTELLKMDRMRADFVANASHELRTPLASVLGFIETLRGPARDDAPAREKFLEIMLKQANRMTRLIDDLLSLSRIEIREHTRPTSAVDVMLILKSTAELLEPQARERNSTIRIEGATDLPMVIGEPQELSQVFHNLTTNALKYGGEHGPVEITAQKVATRPPAMLGQGPCVKISIRDHGEGIPKEHLPRLTERFYRVDTARSRELGGTGLGLAIVKHITNRHRGVLTIESELGKGSTFSVYLPIAGA